MPFMDRDSFIELLNRLGDEDDQTVLAAARTIHARVAEAGFGWNDMLVPAAGPADTAAPPITDRPAPTLTVDGDIQTVIDGLLAHPEISTDTRLDLQSMREDAEAGTLDAGDERYIRALAARLSGQDTATP